MSGPRLLIVADDLTGALDSAGEAARLGIAARAFLSPAALAAAEGQALPPVVAVSTGSREGSAAAALEAMDAVCATLPWLSPEAVMKKVDSRLKGHVFAETARLAAALGQSRLLVAPALPDMGRIQQNGFLSGSGISQPIGIAGHFEGLSAEVPEITDTDQMQRAVESAGLPVGARALAAAMAERLWPGARPVATPRLHGPAVLAIGSRDPITLAQAGRLEIPLHAAPDGELRRDIPFSTCVVQMVPGGTGRPPAEAGALFAQGVASILLRETIATLIACGGETAGAVLSRIGIGCLDVCGLALPGIPVARATLQGARVLHVVTKSGGFGGPDTLAQLVNLVDNRAAAPAIVNYGIIA
ncbi:four-carbon acid sugar kinase family protein [Pannonibacter phragmitetus]|uniref:four-carbon acid sugar kinase family protein n=1 Tax=Pannonibacter phragmitetus TaxID=121719 RepID=UPI000F45287A|nr:four-carbon acid sugar kinase family protein [Pannonibacter phragmitetus]MBA4206665.1 hypothetical protein [Polymorphum sp.]